MKQQVFNPYLPLNEYVPDGEPHVFGERLYVYGSHDSADGKIFCPGNYVVWSAPVDDLSNWQYHGEVYSRTQDPSNAEDKMDLWAPDVAQGADGRYYMFYCLTFNPEIGVAVSDSPAGPFEFYGHVKCADGSVFREFLPFDPGVLVDDDGRVYLYYGFYDEPNPNYDIVTSPGGMCIELEPDMLTVKSAPVMVIPGDNLAPGTEFEGHAYHEAPSIRKKDGLYYLVYSSMLSHELCYAVSHRPNGDFRYGGTIVSNGDVGLSPAVCATGTNHGGMVNVLDKWYFFYHRQTHGIASSRQGCAQEIKFLPAGSIPQVEITSCGLNGGPLEGRGTYSAAVSCHLTGKTEPEIVIFGQCFKDSMPYICEENTSNGPIHMVRNFTDGCTIGWKYFRCDALKQIKLTVRGSAAGAVKVYTQLNGEHPAAQAELSISTGCDWQEIVLAVDRPITGTVPLYIRYEGYGSFAILNIGLE